MTTKADLFLGIFEAIPGTFKRFDFWNPLEMVRILFENPLWNVGEKFGEFGGFCVDSYYTL